MSAEAEIDALKLVAIAAAKYLAVERALDLMHAAGLEFTANEWTLQLNAARLALLNALDSHDQNFVRSKRPLPECALCRHVRARTNGAFLRCNTHCVDETERSALVAWSTARGRV